MGMVVGKQISGNLKQNGHGPDTEISGSKVWTHMYKYMTRSYYSFRCFSFPSAGYVHDIPNMYIKAAAQVLSVLSVVQKGPICTAMY